MEEFESTGGISARGVKEYSRRVEEFVLLGHRTYHTVYHSLETNTPLRAILFS